MKSDSIRCIKVAVETRGCSFELNIVLAEPRLSGMVEVSDQVVANPPV